MTQTDESSEIVDHLRLRLVRAGKVIYDSEKDEHKFSLPAKPLQFCPNCGGATQPVIYMCRSCGIRYVQTQDLKTGRIVVMTLPPDQDIPE